MTDMNNRNRYGNGYECINELNVDHVFGPARENNKMRRTRILLIFMRHIEDTIPNVVCGPS